MDQEDSVVVHLKYLARNPNRIATVKITSRWTVSDSFVLSYMYARTFVRNTKLLRKLK